MKKILSLLLIFSMLGAHAVRAAENMVEIFPGWETTGNASIVDDGTGNHIAKSVNGGRITYRLSRTFNPRFRLTFKANLPVGPDGKAALDINIGANDTRLFYMRDNAKSISEERIEDGVMPDMGAGRAWYQYTANSGYWYGNLSAFSFSSNGAGTAYIDDVTYEVGDDGSFTTFDFDFEFCYVANPDAVKGLVANGDGENVTLIWKNPDTVVKSFKVLENGFDITGGAVFDLTAGGYNRFVYPLSLDSVRKYTLVTETANGTVNQTVIGNRAEKLAKGGKYTADGTPLGGWSLSLQSGETEMYGGVFLDENNALDGDYSLRVNTGIESSNGSAFNNAWNGGKFILYPETTGLTAGKSYKLTYNVKTLNGRGLHALYGETLGPENISTAGAVSTNWKQYEYKFTAADGHKLQLVFDGSADNFWVDGVTLYECDADGNITGDENLLVNGSFDNEIEWPDYEITDNGLFNGAMEVSSLSEGTYKVKTVINNHKVEAGVQAQVMALLKKDGITVKSAASEITNAGIGENEIGFDFEIPDTSDGDYELYIFTWDSLKDMHILTPVKIIK